MEIKTEGITLKRFDKGEKDSIAVVFTLDVGKIPVIARGSKTSLKASSALEVFSLSKLRLLRKNPDSRYFNAAGLSLIESRKGIRSDINRMATAFTFAELTDKFMQNEEVSEEVYMTLKNGMNAVDNCPLDALVSVSAWFKARLLKYTGFSASLDENYLDAISAPDKFSSLIAGFEVLETPPFAPMDYASEVSVYLDGYIISILAEDIQSFKFNRGLN